MDMDPQEVDMVMTIQMVFVVLTDHPWMIIQMVFVVLTGRPWEGTFMIAHMDLVEKG